MQDEKQTLSLQFKMKDIGLLSLFLNIQFNFEGDCVTMHQSKHMLDCKPKTAPSEMNVNKLRISDSQTLED